LIELYKNYQIISEESYSNYEGDKEENKYTTIQLFEEVNRPMQHKLFQTTSGQKISGILGIKQFITLFTRSGTALVLSQINDATTL
jgi:hypothetical protein